LISAVYSLEDLVKEGLKIFIGRSSSSTLFKQFFILQADFLRFNLIQQPNDVQESILDLLDRY
jgi:hypothetical protein